MFGFMSFIEESGNYVGGYLGTDEELMPIEFVITDPIKPANKLQKILYGAQFDMKWFGDLIAGTLFQGAKKAVDPDEKCIEVFFVSDKRMLHLRRRTGNIPVVFIDDNGIIDVHEQHPQDKELVVPILEKVKEHSSVSEVFNRIREGIREKISSDSDNSSGK